MNCRIKYTLLMNSSTTNSITEDNMVSGKYYSNPNNIFPNGNYLIQKLTP